MLGHTLWRECAERFEATATVRSDPPAPVAVGALAPNRIAAGVRAEDLRSIQRALDESDAEVAVNCIGLVKQIAGATPAEMVRATPSSRTSWRRPAQSGGCG